MTAEGSPASAVGIASVSGSISQKRGTSPAEMNRVDGGAAGEELRGDFAAARRRDGVAGDAHRLARLEREVPVLGPRAGARRQHLTDGEIRWRGCPQRSPRRWPRPRLPRAARRTSRLRPRPSRQPLGQVPLAEVLAEVHHVVDPELGHVPQALRAVVLRAEDGRAAFALAHESRARGASPGPPPRRTCARRTWARRTRGPRWSRERARARRRQGSTVDGIAGEVVAGERREEAAAAGHRGLHLEQCRKEPSRGSYFMSMLKKPR